MPFKEKIESNIDSFAPEMSSQEVLAEANNFLTEIAQGLGYTEVGSLEQLNLSAEEKALLSPEITGANDSEFGARKARFFQGNYQDGESLVRVAVSPFISYGRKPAYAADIFSPAEYKGHGMSNDFTSAELKGTLEYAMNGAEDKSDSK